MAPGTKFQPVLQDASIEDPSKVEKVVFLSGKFYYDLVKEREARGYNDRVALVRIEELSPFPKEELKKEIEKYEAANEFVWCQEEPQNAGAYAFMAPRLAQLLPQNKVSYCVVCNNEVSFIDI
jgi:probable 2-oxoglutarate dehydrogenase E1 component DHKTD1